MFGVHLKIFTVIIRRKVARNTLWDIEWHNVTENNLRKIKH